MRSGGHGLGVSSGLVVGSASQLASFESIPELLSIGKEIGRHVMSNLLLWNSLAWSRRLELPDA
jgi:hypothetical protein